jgi:hypothetical protein
MTESPSRKSVTHTNELAVLDKQHKDAAGGYVRHVLIVDYLCGHLELVVDEREDITLLE